MEPHRPHHRTSARSGQVLARPEVLTRRRVVDLCRATTTRCRD